MILPKSKILLLIVMLTALLGQSIAAHLMQCEMSFPAGHKLSDANMSQMHSMNHQVMQAEAPSSPMSQKVYQKPDCEHHTQVTEQSDKTQGHCCDQNCHCSSMGCASAVFLTASHTETKRSASNLKIILTASHKIVPGIHSLFRPPIIA